MSAQKKALPILAAVVAAITWGFSFLFTKNALGHLETFQLLGYRFLVAAVFLTVLVAVGLVKIRLTAQKMRGLLLVALLQPVLYFVGETIGVKLTTTTESGILIALVPLAITMCSLIILKERLSPLSWVAIAISVAGVVLIVLSKGMDSGSGQFTGTLALLGAVVAAGIYNPLSRKVSQQCSPMETTFVMMWVGAIVFNIAGIALHEGGIGSYLNAFANPTVLLDVAYLGVLSSVVAFFCLNYALSQLPSSTVGTFINLTPIITVFAGVLIGRETLLPLQIAGAVLVLAGIWWVARRQAADAAANRKAGATEPVVSEAVTPE